MKKPLGEYRCPNCGVSEIFDPQMVTVVYPKGLESPMAALVCPTCSSTLAAPVSWTDAQLFDRGGAKVIGFSFARGPKISENDIKDFVDNMESEIESFLNLCI